MSQAELDFDEDIGEGTGKYHSVDMVIQVIVYDNDDDVDGHFHRFGVNRSVIARELPALTTDTKKDKGGFVTIREEEANMQTVRQLLSVVYLDKWVGDATLAYDVYRLAHGYGRGKDSSAYQHAALALGRNMPVAQFWDVVHDAEYNGDMLLLSMCEEFGKKMANYKEIARNARWVGMAADEPTPQRVAQLVANLSHHAADLWAKDY